MDKKEMKNQLEFKKFTNCDLIYFFYKIKAKNKNNWAFFIEENILTPRLIFLLLEMTDWSFSLFFSAVQIFSFSSQIKRLK